MVDYDGNEFQVGDWVRGNDIWGKVAEVFPDHLTYQDEDGQLQTCCQAEVEDEDIIVFHYSNIRRRSMANQLPADFFTYNGTPADPTNSYDRAEYLQDLLAEAAAAAGKNLVQRKQAGMLPADYTTVVAQALAANEDAEDFVTQMSTWFASLK